MAKLWRLIADETLQVAVFLILSGIVFFLAVITHLSNSALFERFFGRISALLIVFIVFITGLVLFSFLLPDGQFAVFRGANLKGFLLAASLAVPFAAAMILVDRKSPFPVDMNALFPDSLTFYPVMAYVVEILFHILPFCLLYFLLGPLMSASRIRFIGAIILLVAFIEPIFQVVLTSGRNSVGGGDISGFPFVLNEPDSAAFIQTV